LESVRGSAPTIQRYIERVNADVDRRTTDRLQQTIHKVFKTVLRELDDLDNPMRTSLGYEPGRGGLLADSPENGGRKAEPAERMPSLDDLTRAEPPTPQPEAAVPQSARPGGSRSARLPSIAPDPDPGDNRSRFDPDAGVVLYNEGHADYLLAKEDEAGLLDYLSTLVAKEYVVYNNPKASPQDLSEELIRMLVRVRRHLPKRR
jgi:hypothetical protein